MLQKKNEGILFSAEIRVVGSYTDRLLIEYEWAFMHQSIPTFDTHVVYISETWRIPRSR